MRPRKLPGATRPPSAKLLLGITLILGMVSCGLGEAVMPNPSPGVPVDRSASLHAAVPAPIPHKLDGRQDCFVCHAVGAVDAPPVPANHEQDVTLCTTCHAVWLAPAIAAAAPPVIPHEVEGRDDCLVCHKLGTADAPRVPENHSGLTSGICQTCHSAAGEIAGTGEEAGLPAADAPSIPHGLEGFDACSQCHEEGGPGIPQFPSDHQGRTDDICSACHSPAVEVAEPAPATEVVATSTEVIATTEVTTTPSSETVATPTAEATATPTTRVTSTPTAEVTATTGTVAVATLTQEPPAASGDAANGQTIFAASCAPCHGPDGEGTSIAPDALNDPSLLEELTDDDLTAAIRLGVGSRMPPFPNLSDEEILDLVALLRSWQ